MDHGRRQRRRLNDDDEDDDDNQQVPADNSLDLLKVLKVRELREHVFPFLASRDDLCNLDLVCRSFRSWTEPVWEGTAMTEFGLENGKAGYRKGVSLLRKPIFFEIREEGDTGIGGPYPGSPDLACNGSILAAVDDCIGWDDGDRTYPIDSNNFIALRDARTLNFIRAMPTPTTNHVVAVCGRQGAEVIVTANNRDVTAYQGDRRQDLDNIRWTLISTVGGMLGCETHLIIVNRTEISVLEVGADPLLSFRQSVGFQDAEVMNGVPPCSTARPHHFALMTTDNNIRIWKIHPQTSHVQEVESTQLEIRDDDYDNEDTSGIVVVAEKYIATTCCRLRKIHIFNNSNGEKLHTLCDVDEDEQLDEGDLGPYPIQMEPVGDLLVSTSHLGQPLCVWHMGTGKLLARYDEPFSLSYADELPLGADVTSMVRLKYLPAFVAVAFRLYVWGFPEDERGYKMMQSIKRRESSRRERSHSESSGDY